MIRRPTAAGVTALFAAAAIVIVSGCGARRLMLPSGAGQPFDGFEAAFDEAVHACRSIDTMTSELGVSGRVGGQRLRGRVLTGFARPSSLRLEGLAPFGPPAFILVSTGGDATLLLPRDRAVLQGEPPEAIIEALVGIALTPATLHAILTGCGLAASAPASGSSFPGGWVRVVDGEDVSTWLRQDASGRWSVMVAIADALRVEYEERVAGMPRRVRLELEGADPRTELRLQVAEADLGVALKDEAFTVKIPDTAEPITLSDLRRSGPL